MSKALSKQITEKQIVEAEENLRVAMLASDLKALDRLISDELIFTNHLGAPMSKQDDLLAHQTGVVKIDVLTPAEQRIQLRGDIAIVSVRVHIAGTFGGRSSEGDFRFTRVWALSAGGDLEVVVGHSCLVA